MNTIYISIGSNIEKEKNIKKIRYNLKKTFKKINFSPIFETPFQGRGNQDNYYNLCGKIETEKNLLELKKLFRKIEGEFGRTRGKRKDAPRTMDIDLLLFNKMIDSQENLPYGKMEKTPYVIIPLNSLAPNLILPKFNNSIHYFFKKIPNSKKKEIKKILL